MDERREVITVEYAGFWIRLVAYLIDGIALSAIAFVVVVLSGLYQDSPGEGPPVVPVAAETRSTSTAATLTYNAISVVYVVGFWTWRGQTPGKMALGIKIVRTDGYPIGLGRSVLRYIGHTISGLMFFIGYLWIAIDAEKQGIHDKIAGTYVVKLPRKKAKLAQIYG